MSTTNRLGELLVREKLISLQQLRQAQDEQRRTGQNLGATLGKLGYISDGETTNFHAIDDIKFLTGFNVEPVVASESAIAQAVERFYQTGPSYDEVMAGFDEEEIEFG